MAATLYQKGPIRFSYQTRSHVGRVRANNEDSLIEAAEIGLFGVCDGLGGHAAGEVASSIASSTLREFAQGGTTSPDQALKQGIQEANRRILENQSENPERRGMGTTVTALWLGADDQAGAWIGHVGDSRLYQQRDHELLQITEDHSPVFRLYKQGLLTKDQMQRHPQKNLLERSLGILPRVEIEVFPLTVQSGDIFLICTDGLTDSLSDSEINAVLRAFSVEEAADQLIEQANAMGGFDNITLVLLQVLDVQENG